MIKKISRCICGFFVLAIIVFSITLITEYYKGGFYSIGIMYHDEILSTGYCRSNKALDLLQLSKLLNESISHENNIIGAINSFIEKSSSQGKRSCIFNSVAYTPALENITFRRVVKTANSLYLYFENRNGGEDVIVITFTNYNPILPIICIFISLLLPLRKLVEFLFKDNEVKKEHYILLIALSYSSLGLLINFFSWVGSAFQLTILVLLPLMMSFTLIMFLSIPGLLMYFNEFLCRFLLKLGKFFDVFCDEKDEYSILKRYIPYGKITFLLYSLFIATFIVIIIVLSRIPIKIEMISSLVMTLISITFIVLLSLLNIDNINAIRAAYQINMGIIAIIPIIEYLVILVLFKIITFAGLFVLFLLFAFYILCALKMPMKRESK